MSQAKAKWPLFTMKHRKFIPRIVRYVLTNRWSIVMTRFPNEAELYTLVEVSHNKKFVASKLVKTTLIDKKGKCLGCGQRHRHSSSID